MSPFSKAYEVASVPKAPRTLRERALEIERRADAQPEWKKGTIVFAGPAVLETNDPDQPWHCPCGSETCG